MKSFSFSNFKNLLSINLLTLRRQSPGNKKPSRIRIGPGLGHIFTGIFLGIMYLLLLMVYRNTAILPKTFEIFLIFIFILGIIQSFTVFYGTLYESRDLDALMPLPLTSLEIYISKIAAVFIGSLTFVIPMFFMVFAFNMAMGYPIWLNLIFNLYMALCISVFYIFINILLMEALAYSGILYRFRSSMLAIINILIQIGSFAFIFISQSRLNNSSLDQAFTGYDFSGTFLAPALRDYRNLGPLIIVSLLVSFISLLVIYLLGKNFLSHYRTIQGKKVKIRSKSISGDGSLRKSIYKYKLRYITNNTFISQSIFGTLIIMIMPLINFIIGSAPAPFALVPIAIYLSLSSTLWMTAPSRYIISLDNENFEMIKSLPINMSTYLKYNRDLVWMIMSALAGLALIGLGFYLQAPLWLIGLAVLVNLLLGFSLSNMQVYKDYKNIYIGWQSDGDLFQRSSKLVDFLIFFLLLIFLTIAIILVDVASKAGFASKLVLVMSILSLGLAFVLNIIYSKKIMDI